MAGQYKIEVPKSEKELLQRLQQLNDAAFNEFINIVETARPKMQASVFSESVSDTWRADNRASNIDGIVGMAVRAISASSYSGVPRAEIVKAMLGMIDENSKTVEVDVIEKLRQNDDLKKLESRLSQLMTVEAVQITAAAPLFLLAQQNALTEVAAFSDIRPIFIANHTDQSQPKASVIAHQFKFTVSESGKGSKSIVIALDDSDLRDLRIVVEQTIRKSELLKASETASGRVVIEP